MKELNYIFRTYIFYIYFPNISYYYRDTNYRLKIACKMWPCFTSVAFHIFTHRKENQIIQNVNQIPFPDMTYDVIEVFMFVSVKKTIY